MQACTEVPAQHGSGCVRVWREAGETRVPGMAMAWEAVSMLRTVLEVDRAPIARGMWPCSIRQHATELQHIHACVASGLSMNVHVWRRAERIRSAFVNILRLLHEHIQQVCMLVCNSFWHCLAVSCDPAWPESDTGCTIYSHKLLSNFSILKRHT